MTLHFRERAQVTRKMKLSLSGKLEQISSWGVRRSILDGLGFEV